MNSDSHSAAIKDHWGRADLGDAIREALLESGKDLNALTLDDLAAFDQFHGGGKSFTLRLARLAGLKPEMKILDVGGGLGGPARTLALEFGCHVTVIDITDSYVKAGEMLTGLMNLSDPVTHQPGDALDLPFDDATFNVVWTQNSGMNIADKEGLYAGFHRVLRPDGLLAIQEPMAGPNQPPVFPVMWSRDGSNHFLRTPDQMRTVIETAGFRLLQWDEVTHVKDPGNAVKSKHSIQNLVMGSDLLGDITRAGEKNEKGNRLVMFQAVFERL